MADSQEYFPPEHKSWILRTIEPDVEEVLVLNDPDDWWTLRARVHRTGTGTPGPVVVFRVDGLPVATLVPDPVATDQFWLKTSGRLSVQTTVEPVVVYLEMTRD